MSSSLPDADPGADACVHEARLWRDNGWTARVVKNEDDDGWAVEMRQDGQAEPALVGPWTMGRDKKNPKPLDTAAFHTLVKTAAEVLRRHEQQLHASLHREVTVGEGAARLVVSTDIVADEDDPHMLLAATDAFGAVVARVRAPLAFKLTREAAVAWVDGGFRKPT